MPTRYEMPDETIGLEDAFRVLLHLIERPVADAAEERARVLVANAPSRHDVEEGAQGWRAQAFALGAQRQVGQR